MIDLAILEQIEFHDSPLLQFLIDFHAGTLRLVFDEADGGPRRSLSFEGVTALKLPGSGALELKVLWEAAFAEADFSTEEEGYGAKFVFLGGVGEPAWELSFHFRNLEMKTEGIP